MKRKINTIKGKRLIEGGGENLLTKDEILVETKGDTITLKERDDSGKIKQLSGSGGSSSSDMEYYKVDGMPTSESLSLYKIKLDTGEIKIQGVAEESSRYTKAVAYAPIAIKGVICNTLKDAAFAMAENVTEEEIEEMLSMFTPITKEEFYDLNNI